MVFKPKHLSDIAKLSMVLKDFHLKPVKTLTFSFDPFESNTKSIRDCLQILTSKRVKREGAPRYKIDVRSDRSHPHIDVDFNDGHKIIFKTEHLKPYDVVSRLDVFCKAKDTSLGEADIALTKMAGKQKRKK
ncbi:39S ribosomal protein L53, mitochondrial-like [Mya arenaria]|uniref:39S ribosomal protein L53, mitochondrial-like n=1 Tax=Mya arenaria TaxID=6604 RepID=UPI0022E97848|nr:39S ribosomal protein L53, mitochondrial-like [Mya arenaria]